MDRELVLVLFEHGNIMVGQAGDLVDVLDLALTIGVKQKVGVRYD